MSAFTPSNLKPPVSGAVPYASNLVSPMDIDMPDVSDELAEVLGDQWLSGFGQIQRAMGYDRPTTQETYYHYQDDWYIRTIRTAEAVTAGMGAAGATFTLDIDANDIYTVGSKKLMYAKKGNIVLFPTRLTNGVFYRAFVTDVSPATTPPTITFQLLDSTQSMPALASGIEVIVNSYAGGEGTGQPDATMRNILKRSGKLQIIKATMRATGTEISNGKWFKKTSNGEQIPIFYSYSMQQVGYDMALAEDGALMWMDYTTNTITAPYDAFNIGVPIQTTEGLIPCITKRGNVLPYNIGSFDITDFNQSGLIAESERSGSTMAGFSSYTLLTEMEDVLVDYLKYNDVKYAFGDRAQYLVEIGFQGIRKAGVLYMWKKLDVLSHPQLYAAPGYEDLNNMAVFMPIKRTKAYLDPEKKGTAMLPSFGQRYKQLGSYNRRSQAWNVDGSGYETPANRMVSEYDINQMYMRSHIGGEYTAENQMQLWQGNFA